MCCRESDSTGEIFIWHEVKSMECSCGGALIEGKSCYRVSEEHFLFIIEDIPAYRCTRCDRVLFKDDIVEKLQKLVKKIDRESKEILTGKPSIHSYDY
jgi:YgiT-type zinc finger domain-containing protein